MCIVTMKSMTHAIKAENALAGHGIRPYIVGVDPTLTKHGCAYGLRFPCERWEEVRAALQRRGIAYGERIGRGAQG